MPWSWLHLGQLGEVDRKFHRLFPAQVGILRFHGLRNGYAADFGPNQIALASLYSIFNQCR